MPERAELNPAQQAVIDRLGAPGGERPEFDADLGPSLRAELEAGIEPLLGHLETPLRLTKHGLASVHGCEARHLAEQDAPFVTSVPIARGTVAHKAIELGVTWDTEPDPMDLVDEAIARLTESDVWLADWLQTLSLAERAELRAEANESVAKFLECFPPLSPRWRPVTESRYTADLCNGEVVLTGKVDLTLGKAHGRTAGKVIIDLKTGGFAPAHVEDLRFYALIETIRLGVPPRLVATYYLDQARAHSEDVTTDRLDAAVARTVDGVARMAELAGGRSPVKRPSRACRWCGLAPDCEEGQEFLRDDDS